VALAPPALLEAGDERVEVVGVELQRKGDQRLAQGDELGDERTVRVGEADMRPLEAE
jgi:hypothetical protein